MNAFADDAEIIEGEAREVALADVDASLAAALTGVEIDKQIATARRFPRQLKQVTDRVFNLATLDEQSAEENMYVLPRSGKPIMGPSIRFAEILKQAYGNCRAAARVVTVDRVEKYVEAEGVFHDLETNTATSARVRRRIMDRDGRLFSDDMIIVTGNAACSIALRNAILSGVPKPLWRKAFEAVQLTIRGDMKTLVERRSEAIKAFAQVGVTADQVFQALGVAGAEDVLLEHIPLLRGMFATLKNGEATVEEMFATPLGRGPKTVQTNAGLTERLKGAKEGDPKAEGFTASQGAKSEPEKDAAQAAADAIDGDDIPTEGGAKPPETAQQGKDAPPGLAQRVAAFKTLVDAAEAAREVEKLQEANQALFAEVERGDPDEVGSAEELATYCEDRIAEIEAASFGGGR